MDKLRILFVTSEIDPFLKISDAADLVRALPQGLQEKGHEIRILMPKFGVINERRNRLHEVVRLSGINIRVGDEEKPLTIKVASIPNAKLQVYFLDNEDYFKRKSVLTDPTSKKFHADNDERAIFFCKGVIETVKKLGWAPDIIHLHDWMTSFIPLYLKTQYADDPMFKNTKIVYTVYNNGFKNKLPKDFLQKTNVEGNGGTPIEHYNENTYFGVVKGGMSLSDVVTIGAPKIDAKVQEYITENQKEDYSFKNDDSDKNALIESYQDLYATILN